MTNSGRRGPGAAVGGLDVAVGGLDVAVAGRRAPPSLAPRGVPEARLPRIRRDARSGRLWSFRSFSSQAHRRNYSNYLVSTTSHFETLSHPAARGN